LFSIKEDAKNLKWHVDGRKCDNLLRHPVDSPQWKKIDETFPHFGAEPRNLRLGLAINGMNPYGNLSRKHSFIATFVDDLPSLSFVVHEEKIYDVVYDDIGS